MIGCLSDGLNKRRSENFDYSCSKNLLGRVAVPYMAFGFFGRAAAIYCRDKSAAKRSLGWCAICLEYGKLFQGV